VLTVHGLDGVRLGMTISQAEEKLGAKLGKEGLGGDGVEGERCWYWGRLDALDPGVLYMVEHGVITRIDAWSPNGTAPNVKTAAGIAVGASEASLRAAYGYLMLEPQPANPGGSWGVLEVSGDSAIRAVVTDGSVTALFAARGSAIDYLEGCS
jgi:hypothetical protein